MKGNLRKKIVSAIAAVAMFASSLTFTVWAETNSITKIYADTMGVDIVFENAVAEADYGTLGFEKIGGAAVDFDYAVEENILHVHFDEKIEIDTAYKLTVAGEEKAVTIKELFFEDFEDNALSQKANAGSIRSKDRNGIDWVANQGNAFCAILDGSKYGSTGHWLAITDAPFMVNKALGTLDMSINADIMMYNGLRRNNNNTDWVGYTSPTGQIFLRGTSYPESYTVKIADVGKRVQVGVTSYKGTGSYGLITGYKYLATDITYGSITAPSASKTAESPSNDDWANMTYTIDSLAKPYNYTARGYDNTAAAYFENEYVGTFIDSVDGRFADQRCGVQSNAAGTMLIDNVLVTTCVVEDIKNVEITRAYADANHFELHFAEDLSGKVVDASGVTLKKLSTGETVELSVSDFDVHNNTIRVNKALERDTAYSLSVKKGFGTAVIAASNDFDVVFTVKTLWYEDFESGTGADLVNTEIRVSTTNSKEFPVIKNGKLYTISGLAPMADELKVYEDATFTANMSIYKRLENTSNFATNYNKAIPYAHVGFNAINASINNTNDLRWSSNNYGVRQFGWYFMNNGQRRYHNWVDDVVVVTPAEGTSYKAGDVVSDKLSKGYGINSPTEKIGTVEGIGTVDFGQHFAHSTHKAFSVGDGYYNSSTGELTIYEKGDTLPGTFQKADGTAVTVSECEAVPFEIKVEKQGSTGTLVFDGVAADTYKTAEEDMTKGYFGFGTNGVEIFVFEDMLVTAYVETEVVKEVELGYADRYGVVLDGLKGTVTGAPEGVVIYDINEKKNIEISGANSVDDSMFVEAKLETGKPYKVTVKSDSKIGDVIYIGDEYSEVFMVNEVLKVEPTVQSIKQLNNGIGGAVANKIVQGDGFVSLFGMTLKTPSYDNATIETEIAYYADVPNGAPYINNYFGTTVTAKYLYDTANNKTEAIPVGGFKTYHANNTNLIVSAGTTAFTDTDTDKTNLPYMRTDVKHGISYGAYGCERYSNNVGSASSVWNGEIMKEVESHKERFVMAGDAYRLYMNDVAVAGYKGSMAKPGFVQYGGSARGLTKLYGMTITQMELIDNIELDVKDISADAKEITVVFDKSISGADDFSKIEVLENGEINNATIRANGKELIIIPDGGIKSGSVYSVTVSAGFGPSEICYTSKDANKNFKVTVYADVDFEDGADEAVTFDGVVNYKDGAAMFTNGSMIIDNLDMATAKNYTVKYDYKQYAALEIGGQYNVSSEVSKWFNRVDKESVFESGYYWLIGDKTVPMSGNTVAGAETAGIAYGDAVVNDNEITVVEKGESLEDYEIFIDDEIVTESDRTAVKYAYEIQKSGAGAKLIKDGTLVHTFAGTETADASEKGYFGISTGVNSVVTIDNIQAYTFEEVTGVDIRIDVAGGKVIVSNYGEEAIDMVVVVAAYTNTNGMISAFKSLPVTASAGITEVPYTLENTTGAKTYKAFAWDNLTNLDPYCEAAVYEVN